MGNCLQVKEPTNHKDLEWKLKFMVDINNEYVEIKMNDLENLGVPRDVLIGTKSNINIQEVLSLLKIEDRRKIDTLIETDPITIKKLENFVYDIKMYKKIIEIWEDLYLKVLQSNFYNKIVNDNSDVLDIFDDVLEKTEDVEMYEDDVSDTVGLLKKTPKKKVFLPNVPTHEIIKMNRKKKANVVVPI